MWLGPESFGCVYNIYIYKIDVISGLNMFKVDVQTVS